MLSPAVAGALARVYVPNLRSNDVYVIDPATRKVVDRFPVGLIPQHVVPSWDLQTLWVANNGRRRADGSLTPIDPKTGKPGTAHSGRRPLQHVFHARRQGGDRRRRAPEAARFPRSRIRWQLRAIAADPGLLRRQPRRFLDRRALRDLHLRVPRRRPGQNRHGQPQGARLSEARRPRHAAGHPHLARRQALLRRRHAGRRRVRGRRRQLHQGRVHPHRHRHPRALSEPRRHASSTSPTAARTRSTGRRTARAASASSISPPARS